MSKTFISIVNRSCQQSFKSLSSPAFQASRTALPIHHTRRQLTTTSKMAANITFTEALKERRTFYALNKKSPIPDSKIKEIAAAALQETPSAFNSQSTRIVILLGADHDKFWDTTLDILKAVTPEDKFESTKGRIGGFKAGYGTVLFYEDPQVIKGLQEKYAIYSHYFPEWSEHTSGMHQYVLWTAFEAEGFGVNLQHYNPLVNQKVSEIWGVPAEWELKAEMVIGGLPEGAREQLKPKDQTPIEKRLQVHGAK